MVSYPRVDTTNSEKFLSLLINLTSDTAGFLFQYLIGSIKPYSAWDLYSGDPSITLVLSA